MSDSTLRAQIGIAPWDDGEREKFIRDSVAPP